MYIVLLLSYIDFSNDNIVIVFLLFSPFIKANTVIGWDTNTATFLIKLEESMSVFRREKYL